MASFSKLPANASIPIKPFKAAVSDEDLRDFLQLLKLSKIGVRTYENLQEDRRFGVSHDWITKTVQYWQTSYSWRKTEDYINSYPNFIGEVKDDNGEVFEMHFIGLFSSKPDAIPVVFLHGWPGSFLEFMGILKVVATKFTADTLPYHIIVPSLPGYGYSGGPPLSKNFETSDISRIVDKLMIGIGFGTGYVAQGGDIGSGVARILGMNYDTCRAVHINFGMLLKHRDSVDTAKNDKEKEALQRAADFFEDGAAYSAEHRTRPATIGLVLSSSPIAQLAWIGEKFLEWSDTDPSIDTILDDVTLYWFTNSFSRGIYPYRAAGHRKWISDPIQVPLGYSGFPHEIAYLPRTWAEEMGNLVFYRIHSSGGHFAAMEKPDVLFQDVEDFIQVAKPKIA